MRWIGRESGREQVLEAAHEPEGSHHRSFKVLVVTGVSHALNFSKGTSHNRALRMVSNGIPRHPDLGILLL